MDNKFKTGERIRIVNHKKAKLLDLEAIFEFYGENGDDCVISINDRKDKYIAYLSDIETIEKHRNVDFVLKEQSILREEKPQRKKKILEDE